MEKPAKKTTIKDIAELAGVSIGTVDRVIHNRGEVSEKTKEKILGIIENLNFKPDVLASALASKKNVRFAILMPAADEDSSFWKIPNNGIDKAKLEMNHYNVQFSQYLFSLSDKNSFLEVAYQALSDRPDAILIAPSFQTEATEIAGFCSKNKIPFAFFNSDLNNLDEVCYVGQDAIQSGKLAAKIMDYGMEAKSEILLVSILSFLKNNSHIRKRKQGFVEYFEERKDREIKLINLEIDSLHVDDVYEALRKAFLANPGIKGVFVTNSRVFHIARFIELEKLKHVNLIGYDLTEENIPYLENGIISFLINQKPVEQAYRAILALFNKIVLKKEVANVILLPIDIVTKENLKYYE